MSEFTLTLLQLGFLALLWIFVLSAISVIRSDLFGARVESQPSPRSERAAEKAAARSQRQARPSRRNRGAPTHLLVTEGPNAGQRVPLDGESITLGRGNDANVRLEDDYVSTHHARFVTDGEDWFVEDLGSTNGTYLGSTRVARATTIGLGTPVRLGKTVVELRK